MKFLLLILNKTPLNIAVENYDIEMVNLLLSHPKINVNHKFVLKYLIFL